MRLLSVATTTVGRRESTALFPVLFIKPDVVFGPMEILQLLRGSVLREEGVLLGASSPGQYVRVVVSDLEEAARLLEGDPRMAAIRRLFVMAQQSRSTWL